MQLIERYGLPCALRVRMDGYYCCLDLTPLPGWSEQLRVCSQLSASVSPSKQRAISSNTAAAIKINTLFPYILSEIGERNSANIIHITTDCVWSGKEGNYNEDSPHDALDVYGKTKSLGEPGNCTVIRICN